MIYLDWASTSPPDEAILQESAALAVRFFGNPSSKHGLGAEASERLEEARARLLRSLAGEGGRAASATCPQGRIAFTSGGSEADAIALLAMLRRKDSRRGPAPHIVVSAIEHSAVYEEARLLEGLGMAVSYVNPGPDGILAPGEVASALRKDTALVAIMAVNNETGAIQPLAEIAAALGEASAALGRHEPPFFHSDAVQALGKVSFDPEALGLSSAAFSAHKLRGPRGTGALWLDSKLEPLVLGGGQEEGLRPGTENLQGDWAFSLAAEKARASLDARRARARSLEARLMSGLSSIEGALALPLGRAAGDERYSPFILSVAFPGLSGEVLARALSDAGIAVSTGAACSNRGNKKGRRILEAMGLKPELAFSAIRVSTGDLTGEADIDAFLEEARSTYRKLKI